MDAAMFITTVLIIVFFVLNVWSFYLRSRRWENRLTAVALLLTFAALWVILGLLWLGVPGYVAYVAVAIIVTVLARLYRQNWRRTLDKYMK